MQKTMLNDYVNALCQQHTYIGIHRCSVANYIIQISLLSSTCEYLQRFLQSCPATLAANGSHALYNLGYTGKIRYKVNEKGSIWVKYSVEKCGNLLQKEYLPSISTQKSCICFGLIISEAKPQKTCHMHFNRDGSFYLCQYALDIKDTILDKITICYVNGSQIPRVKLLCVFLLHLSPFGPL